MCGNEFRFPNKWRFFLPSPISLVLPSNLVDEVLARRADAALDGDDGAVEQEAHVDLAEGAGADEVGIALVLGGVGHLLQREPPGALVVRRR